MTSKEIKRSLRWAVKEATAMLGAHIGGPNEEWFKEQIRLAKKAYKEVSWLIDTYKGK